MEAWKDKILHSSDVARLYNDKPREWLLLEVIKTGSNGKAELFKLLAHAINKDDLYEYVMEDEEWGWDKKYIFVFADPDSICEL